MKFSEIAAETEFFFEEDKPNTDWKKTPKWLLSYRQKVTPSDVFLQVDKLTLFLILSSTLSIIIFTDGSKKSIHS